MPDDSFIDEIVAECDHCGTRQKVRVNACAKLKVGDALYHDPTNHNFGRCRKCQRTKMTVVEAPTTTVPSNLQGFWKLPGA